MTGPLDACGRERVAIRVAVAMAGRIVGARRLLQLLPLSRVVIVCVSTCTGFPSALLFGAQDGPRGAAWGQPAHVMPANLDEIGEAFRTIEQHAERGESAAAESKLTAMLAKHQANYFLWLNVADYYRHRRLVRPMMDAFTRALETAPNEPTALHSIAFGCIERIAKDRFEPSVWIELADVGLAAIDRALILEPDYIDGTAVKALLLRAKGRVVSDPVAGQVLLREGAALMERVRIMRELASRP